MSRCAIRAEGLSKRYLLGERVTYSTLRDVISRGTRRIFGGRRTDSPREIWALSDVSFEVERGEVLGIIGRNGAGKSTLLKILSRITEPTRGHARLCGRVGSLLEVGTGFHPELTGRENVFLNGAILGMTRREIHARFDEIIAFSEVEKFVDTPVKRYSSGMRMRLAFSVAAHLEPELLFVDEVLAVGDAAFQRRCLRRMDDVASRGRTVLFVSHNMAAVSSLCTRAILLRDGQLVEEGAPSKIIESYIGTDRPTDGDVLLPEPAEPWTSRLKGVRLLDRRGQVATSVGVGEACAIEIDCEVREPLANPSVGVVIQDRIGQNLIRLTMRETHGEAPAMREGGRITLEIPSLPLLPGSYYLQIGLVSSGRLVDLAENALLFDVHERAVYPTGKLPARGRAVVYAPCEWKLEYR
jgi:lipopolysaccharide transport system ATP-binding protein